MAVLLLLSDACRPVFIWIRFSTSVGWCRFASVSELLLPGACRPVFIWIGVVAFAECPLEATTSINSQNLHSLGSGKP